MGKFAFLLSADFFLYQPSGEIPSGITFECQAV